MKRTDRVVVIRAQTAVKESANEPSDHNHGDYPSCEITQRSGYASAWRLVGTRANGLDCCRSPHHWARSSRYSGCVCTVANSLCYRYDVLIPAAYARYGARPAQTWMDAQLVRHLLCRSLYGCHSRQCGDCLPLVLAPIR